MKLILIRNLSSSNSMQPAFNYMKAVFAHNPHFLIKNVESSPAGSSHFANKEKITIDYDVLPGSSEDIEIFIRKAIANRADLQLFSLESPSSNCGFSPHF